MIDHALRFNLEGRAGEASRAWPRRSGSRTSTGDGFLAGCASSRRGSASRADAHGGGRRSREQLDRLAELAIADTCHPNNPRPVRPDDLRRSSRTLRIRRHAAGVPARRVERASDPESRHRRDPRELAEDGPEAIAGQAWSARARRSRHGRARRWTTRKKALPRFAATRWPSARRSSRDAAHLRDGQAHRASRATSSTALQGRLEFFLASVDKACCAEQTVVHDERGWRSGSRTSRSGVVANISAWNYPYFVGSNVFVPALLTGNAVLYKPSEFATLTGLAIAERCCTRPASRGRVRAVIGGGEAGRGAPGAAASTAVFFTGSYAHRPQDRGGGGAAAHEGAARAGRQGSRLRVPTTWTWRPPPTATGRRRLLQHRPELLLGGAHLRPREGPRRLRRGVRGRGASASWSAIPMDEKTYIGPVAREATLARAGGAGGGREGQGRRGCSPAASARRAARQLLRAHRVRRRATTTWRSCATRRSVPSSASRRSTDDEEALRLMNDTEYGLTAGVYTGDDARAQKILARRERGVRLLELLRPREPAAAVVGARPLGRRQSRWASPGIRAFVQPKAWHLKRPTT